MYNERQYAVVIDSVLPLFVRITLIISLKVMKYVCRAHVKFAALTLYTFGSGPSATKGVKLCCRQIQALLYEIV